MIPRALLHGQPSTDPQSFPELEISWFDYHPGDKSEQIITSAVLSNYDEPLSHIWVEHGLLVYIRWLADKQYGVAVIMAAVLDDFFKIGLETYNWSQFVSVYTEIEPDSWDEISSIFEQDYSDPDIEKIPKEIHREWFDTAINGGQFSLERDSRDYHYNVANIFGYFPWIIYFSDGGRITSDSFELDVSISAEFDLDQDEIFDHIDGDLDEKFWLLIYQFVLQLDTIEEDKRSDTWYRFLQAVHEFTTDSTNYQRKLDHMFNYQDLLHIFDFTFLRSYVQTLLLNIADQPASAAICDTLLKFTDLLLEMEFTDLAKLTEATTLEHALQLDQVASKSQIILDLTSRSSNWGDNHLISFIQSLIDLLPQDKAGKDILSDAINLVTDQLQQSWDGMLCLVEGKLIADRIGDALSIRFAATEQIGDKFSKSEDIFAAVAWSLQFDYDATELIDLITPYLDFAFTNYDDAMLVDQTDILVQTAINHNRLVFLRYYLQYLRTQLARLDPAYHRTLLGNIEKMVVSSPDLVLHRIEVLLTRLLSLQFQEEFDPDQPFQLVSQIYNSINPTLSAKSRIMGSIAETIIGYATSQHEWSLIEETRRRYLLLVRDQEQANQYLKSIYFKISLNRSRLPAKDLKMNDIGIRLFNEGIELADLVNDYDLIARILPHIKRLAIKSRSYSELTNLILTEIKLNKLHDVPWIDQLLEDLQIILNRGSILDVNMVFSALFSDLDLNEQERRTILMAQLDLAEKEPDLLTADQIYAKRIELAQMGDPDDTQQEFLVNNYQQGVSELMSKGDTTNLTNLLFDAISFTQQHSSPELQEFKLFLLDNFENVTQEFKSSQSGSRYQYLLTFWRKIIDTFAHTDLVIVVKASLRLVSLNLKLYSQSSNNQYLRRAQLILKELVLSIDQNAPTLSEELDLQLEDLHNQLTSALINHHQDFGITAAVFQSALFHYRLNKMKNFYPVLDRAISTIKGEIVADATAQSSIFLLMLLLSELSVILEADFNEDIMEELINRVKRLLSFGLSLDLSVDLKAKLSDLHQSVHQSPESFFHEFPFSIGQYLDDSILSYQI